MRVLRSFALFLAASLFTATLSVAQTTTWTIDPNHSTAQFTVRHLAISNVSGNFTKVTGSVVLNEKDLTQSQVRATIDASSIDTRVPDRDKDLRSPNFLDVEKYPTREVTLEVDGPTPELSDPWGNVRRGFSATTTINRKDYGVVWNNTLKTGEAVVGDNVKIQIDVEIMRKKS